MWTCGLVSTPDRVNKWLFLDSLGNHDLLLALDLAHVGFSLFGCPETWPQPWVPSLTQKPVACGEQVETVRGQSSISFRRDKFWRTTGEKPDHEGCCSHPQHNSMQPLRLVASATVQAVQASRKWCSRPGPLIGARSQIGYQSETR